MTGGRTAPRILIAVSVLTLVVAVVGFVVTLVLNAFVFDKYNAYGEVPIPGTGQVHLPEGQATVSFHTQTIGSTSGGLPVPPLELGIDPPDGVPEPQIIESYGTTTTINNDAHVRVWRMEVAAEATYNITAGGQVDGYINPRLAFGHDASRWWLVWMFAGLFVVGAIALAASITWAMRRGRRPSPAGAPQATFDLSDPYTPSADGIRFEQLRHLSALRDSGALTEEEFQAEKRRLMNWGAG
ncbi:hypothetical protein CQY20_17770 [Mycolicibacterium agri]|uniref:SHOCT domain-containing protein n=1 Tax=Mycolicibacterium agri TaxID=36811 RepID=A0A2A7MZT2_MYCAG|nr:SHOCT domain-containing protein [Mycolicibacterium agri]PEG36801.1 hypothetical protein CQY20_17770 [Mycolicibacterium agri]GFG50716.1 hypothetical protein MAGR_21570 [Mycolicibacterium agri]